MVASHSQHATWLYPTPETEDENDKRDEDQPSTNAGEGSDGDINMQSSENEQPLHANKYRPFLLVEQQLTRNLKKLLSTTTPEEVHSSNSTMVAGALTLALSHINRETIAYADTHGISQLDSETSGGAGAAGTGVGTAAITASGLPPPPGSSGPAISSSSATQPSGLQSRILIISVSSAADSAHQYIPIMNSIFACQRLRIPIDICKLTGDAVFLQQACDATRGIYIGVDSPRGFLQYLMLAFLPDQRARSHLVLPTYVDVDFRAACFCHRKVVDVGFVCSICLSIFCEPPEGGDCLICGSHLEMGNYGAKPVVVSTKKKKRKKPKGLDGNGASSGAATPTPMSTPIP